MRVFLAALATIGALFAVGSGVATARTPTSARAAQAALGASLAGCVGTDAGADGAYVVDLNTGQTLYAAAPDVPRLPASVEKIYTTSTALLRFGPNATLDTEILGSGWRGPLGAWHGTLYLRGGGDPTFGSASFDQSAYGTGATMQQLVATLRRAGITGVYGRIVGDESLFDALRGTAPYGYAFALDIGGSLSALAYNRGLTSSGSHVARPATFVAQQLARALRAAGAKVPANTRISAGVTPRGAKLLASVSSPPMATLIRLTNAPSDNFLAETLLKDIGAKFGSGGTSAAGAAVVRAQVAQTFNIDPQLDDGSGLSRGDLTTPRQVVTALTEMASNPYFVNSLAIGGETGTLQSEMQGTLAQGNCRGKTGTLSDVANLAGYCVARNGDTLVFAFLMNSVGNTDYSHAVEAHMAVALANYNG
jgi:D-alanyl-D-alanine carboxypeptidase/D-alanyl-D-alanine-endopeptidase (penicillin-binding protein 4)